jgi:hypothetical protein
MVRVLVACGTPQSVICAEIPNRDNRKAGPLSLKTLRRAFRKELDDGKLVANSLVARSLFKRATGTGPQSVTAAIFWMKCQAGWKEPVDAAAVASLDTADAARKLREAAAEMGKATSADTA